MSMPEAPRRSAAPSRPGDPLVLLVDDYQDAREMYADYLAASGFRTAQAADGHEALAKARELCPHLILMDLSLPGVDGWEVTRLLKQDPQTQHMAIVALTAHALDGEEDRARQAGCDAFIAKPCLPEQLVAEILRLLGEGTAGADRLTR